MRVEDISQFVGQVVGLALVSGANVTTLIKEVTPDGYVKHGELLMFYIQAEPRNPGFPPSPSNPVEAVIKHVSFGQPLYSVSKTNQLAADHIMMVLMPPPEQVAAYNQITSGIVAANPGMLDAIRDIDFTKLGDKR